MSYVANGNYFDAGVAAEDKALIAQFQSQWTAANEASKAAKESGDMAAYQTAEAAKQTAHNNAEQVRAYYGYSGGGDGSEFIPTAQATRQTAQAQVLAQAAAQRLANEYQNLYSAQNNAYQEALAQQKAAQEAAVRKTVNSLESQKTDTEAQYADLFRQLYVNKMRNQKNMSQQLAASGITGGAAESTRLGYDTAYEDALRQGEQGRINAINSLDQAITDARLTGDISTAQAAADAAKEQTSAYADVLRYLINRQDTLDARQESYAREDAQRAAVYAQQLAREQREAEEEAEKAAKPALTVAQVNAAIKAGVLTDAVLAAYEYYYGEPYRG